MTHRPFPAVRKGRHRGPGKTHGNGIGGRSRGQELCLGSRDTFCEALGQTGGREVSSRVFH
jgi:hypothetical protein